MVGHRRRYHPRDFGDQQWARLLAFALDRSDAFECAIPYPYVAHDLDAVPLWPPELDALRDDVLERHVSTIRWACMQDYATQFVRLRVTPALRDFAREAGPLASWKWSNGLPEDPAFLRRGAVILTTESASGRIAVYADRTDVAQLTDAGVQLIEPLDVRAEPWPTP